jgi:hypothetical protein
MMMTDNEKFAQEILEAKCANFHQLLSECLRHGYIDAAKVSPSWLRAANQAVADADAKSSQKKRTGSSRPSLPA